MAKMKLEIDALRVESFVADAGDKARGTVRARSDWVDEGEFVLLPVTDWKTCQGDYCTARTLCHNSCLGGECLMPNDTIPIDD